MTSSPSLFHLDMLFFSDQTQHLIDLIALFFIFRLCSEHYFHLHSSFKKELNRFSSFFSSVR